MEQKPGTSPGRRAPADTRKETTMDYFALLCPAGINTVSESDLPIRFDSEEERDAFVAGDPCDGFDIAFTREATDYHYIMRRFGTPEAIVSLEEAQYLCLSL